MRYINKYKLEKYLEEGKILEFRDDKEFAIWFTHEVSHCVANVNMMKMQQGEYGFSIGNKRYHILVDDALDVYEQNCRKYSDEEVKLIYDALNNYANRLFNMAKEFPQDSEIVSYLMKSAGKYQSLQMRYNSNIKSCKYIHILD